MTTPLVAATRKTAGVFLLGLCVSAGAGTQVQSQEDPSLYAHPKNGGPRRFEVTIQDLPLLRAPTADAARVVTLDKGAVMLNLGCMQAEGIHWCEVRPLLSQGRGFADAQGLTSARGPDGTLPMGVDDSKTRARRQDFDAETVVPCAQEVGQQLGSCRAQIARGTGGDAAIVVTFPNGFARSLYFMHGAFVSASATMSGAGRDISWQLKDGLHQMRADDQRFEVPDSFLLGGPG